MSIVMTLSLLVSNENAGQFSTLMTASVIRVELTLKLLDATSRELCELSFRGKSPSPPKKINNIYQTHLVKICHDCIL